MVYKENSDFKELFFDLWILNKAEIFIWKNSYKIWKHVNKILFFFLTSSHENY